MKIRILIASCAVVVAAIATSIPAIAGFPGTNGVIVYGANNVIQAIAPEGGEPRTLTTPGGDQEMVPNVSPDGSKILYSKYFTISGGLATFVMNSAGGEQRELASTMKTYGASWAPSGQQMIIEGPSCNSEGGQVTSLSLFIAAADGTQPVYLTEGKQASWSPRGDLIVFERPWRGEGILGGSDIYTIRPDGTGLANLTNDPRTYSQGAEWSPDGSTIAFSRGDPTGLWFMGADGSNNREVVAGRTGGLAWSPDGSQIAIAEYSNQRLTIIRTDGSVVRTLTADALGGVDWSVATPSPAPSSSPFGAPTQPAGEQLLFPCNKEQEPPPTSGGGREVFMVVQADTTRSAVTFLGNIQPPHEGHRIKVTLSRRPNKDGASYKRVDSKSSVIDADGNFRGRFPRPKKGLCMITAVFPGDTDHESERARYIDFRC